MNTIKKFFAKLLLGSSDMVDHFIDLSTARTGISETKQTLAALAEQQNFHQQTLAAHSDAFNTAKARLTSAFNGE